jgi:CheY-like chemotaxis protein
MMLGGAIKLRSKAGKGSIFTLYILKNLKQKEVTDLIENKQETTSKMIKPEVVPVSSQKIKNVLSVADKIKYPHVKDDRKSLGKKDKPILIIEDDLNFAQILLDLCHEKGYKCIHESNGAAGLVFAKQFNPVGVLLDIYLPESNGLQILDILKDDLNTRHIPVHVMNIDDKSVTSLQKGAVGFLKKPVNPGSLEVAINKIISFSADKTNQIMLIEDDKNLL